jgi:hypothetical protein
MNFIERIGPEIGTSAGLYLEIELALIVPDFRDDALYRGAIEEFDAVQGEEVPDSGGDNDKHDPERGIMIDAT